MERPLNRTAIEPRGIPPHKWGAAAWTFIHYVAAGYPKRPTLQDADEYARFFSSLEYVLPCKACRDHLHDHMRRNPPNEALAGGRDALFAWTVRLHNIVNESLGRPTASPERMARWYARRRLLVAPRSRRWTDAILGAIAAFVLTAICTALMCWMTHSKRSRRAVR
jgi:hypothetical protein